MPRTNIAVDENVSDSLAEQAGRENKTLYALANEALEDVLKICKDGGNLKEVYPSWKFARILKDLDSVPLPGSLLEKLIKRLYDNEKVWLLASWFEEGVRLGAYLRMSAPTIWELRKEMIELQGMLPVNRIELRRARSKYPSAGSQDKEDELMPDKSGEENELVIRAAGIGLSEESTLCAEQLISGIISCYGLKVTTSLVRGGIIELMVTPVEKTK